MNQVRGFRARFGWVGLELNHSDLDAILAESYPHLNQQERTDLASSINLNGLQEVLVAIARTYVAQAASTRRRR
jgi:hypothetical protein